MAANAGAKALHAADHRPHPTRDSRQHRALFGAPALCAGRRAGVDPAAGVRDLGRAGSSAGLDYRPHVRLSGVRQLGCSSSRERQLRAPSSCSRSRSTARRYRSTKKPDYPEDAILVFGQETRGIPGGDLARPARAAVSLADAPRTRSARSTWPIRWRRRPTRHSRRAQVFGRGVRREEELTVAVAANGPRMVVDDGLPEVLCNRPTFRLIRHFVAARGPDDFGDLRVRMLTGQLVAAREQRVENRSGAQSAAQFFR